MNIAVRIIWFVCIGWWLGLIWFGLSLTLMLTIIFFPIGAWATTKTWKIMTLAGSDSPSQAINDISVEVENKIGDETDNNLEASKNADNLRELKDLHEEGIITDEEFEEKKEELIEEL